MCPQPDEQPPHSFTITPGQGKQVLVHLYGSGANLLIALHGFDYDGSIYRAWEDELGKYYTICAPDLPFHGATEWNEHWSTPTQQVNLIQAIAQHQQVERFTLAGHSLGARILLCTAPELWRSVERYIFLAPAGIGSFDRVLPHWVQTTAEWALNWPFWLKGLIRIGAQLGIVRNFHQRYAEVQLYPPEKRFRLFRTYNSLIHLSTTTADRVAYWQQNTVETLIILASQDRFVPNKSIRAYFAAVPKVEWLEITSTHDLVHKESAKAIRVAIQK